MAKYIQDIRQGDSRTIRINYGKGFDITGWSFYFVMKKDLNQTTADVDISATVGSHPEDDPLNGIANLFIPASVTASLTECAYYYSLKRSDNGTNPDIKTILPPIDEYNDRIRVIKALKIV